MLPVVLILIGLFLLLVGGLFIIRSLEIRRAWLGSRSFRLHFPRNTDADAVTLFITSLAGLRTVWFKSFFVQPVVIFEVHASGGEIEHVMHVPGALTATVLNLLRSALPSVRVDPPEPKRVPPVSRGIELGISTEGRPLRTANSQGLASALLSSLQPLSDDESLILQWIISPAPLATPPRLGSGKERSQKTVASYGDGFEVMPHAEALKAERGKQAELLFFVSGRLAARAKSAQRADALTERVMSCFQILSASGVQLRQRWLVSRDHAAIKTRRRTIPVVQFPMLLNAAELSGAIAWPIGLDVMPALTLGGCRQLPPDSDVASKGTVIGMATYPGSERPVAMRPEDRLLNTIVTGPTGTGKSTLLLSMLKADVDAGRGLCLVDFKGDLANQLLDTLPTERINDVIVLDPSDDKHAVVGLNLLDTKEASADLVIDGLVHVFHEMYGAHFGPRSADLLLAGCHTLTRRPGQTVCELPLLFGSKTYRAPLVALVQDDPIALATFWSQFEALRPNEQATVLGPISNKLRQMLLRRSVKYCVGQSEPRFTFTEAFNSKKIVVINLSQGKLGDEVSTLLGNLLFARIWQVVQARTAQAPEDRVPLNLYIDEAHRIAHGVSDIGDMLSQCRGLGLGVTLATQALTQFDRPTRDGILANCRSKIVFTPSADDASTFAKQFAPFLSADDLKGLGRYEIVAQLAVGQRIAPPFTAVTPEPPKPTDTRTEAIRLSRETYGVSVEALQAEMAKRHAMATPTTGIGRQKRPPRKSA